MSFKEQKPNSGIDESYITFEQGNVITGIRMPYFGDELLANADKGHKMNAKGALTEINILSATLYFKTAPVNNVVLTLYVNNVSIGTITVTGGTETGTQTVFANTPYAEGSLLSYEFTTLSDTGLEGELIIESEDL